MSISAFQVDLRSLLTPLTLKKRASWRDSDHRTALAAFQRSSTEILDYGSGFRRTTGFGGLRQDWLETCRAALENNDATEFFESRFAAFSVSDPERPEGLFTGYFEPEVEGSLDPGPEFPVPVYGRPDDLVAFSEHEERQMGLRYGRRANGKPSPYFTRREIEEGALAGKNLEICWLRDWADAFFMHVQGSGRVRLAQGGTLRLAYSAKNGQSYTGIGRVLCDCGILTRETMSMQSVRAWMRAHPNDARELMWQNRSYVFFRNIAVDNDELGAPGAAQVNLTPLRSLAIDRRFWMFGTPMWIETSYPPEASPADPTIRRLMIAQDTGTAIKGYVRGDFYWGWGARAAGIAGHMKSPGAMTVLLPKPVAARLGLPT